MNVHKNARSCPASRALLMERVERQGWKVAAAAQAIGISARRGREWIRRARANDPLTDRSSRPRRFTCVPAGTRELVVQLRRERFTLAQIAERTKISLSSVARICRAKGLNRLHLVDAEVPPPIQRYERERAGELLHLDIKKLGRFSDVGHRITGKKTFGKGGGWEYVHVAIDDFSRVTYAEILADEQAVTVVGFLKRAVAWFALRGVTIERVLTDNGPAYLSRLFADACAGLGIKHRRTRPYTPRTNGKAERVIQTLLREWAYRFAYPNSEERRHWLLPYLHFYNQHRRHSALGYNPPFSRLVRNNLLTIDS
jgi:transposase InsO family protein